MHVAELSQRTGIPASTLYSYTSNVGMPSAKAIKKIADAFNTTTDALLKEEIPAANVPSAIQPSGKEGIIKVPVVGRIHAGEPVVADANIERYTYVYAEKSLEGQLFALEIKGDSMSPDITEGQTCIVKKSATAENGDIVVALVDREEVIIRKIYHSNGNVFLQAINQAYPPVIIKESEMFRVLGVVMFCQRRFK